LRSKLCRSQRKVSEATGNRAAAAVRISAYDPMVKRFSSRIAGILHLNARIFHKRKSLHFYFSLATLRESQQPSGIRKSLS
jgi:hypothetical protein